MKSWSVQIMFIIVNRFVLFNRGLMRPKYEQWDKNELVDKIELENFLYMI